MTRTFTLPARLFVFVLLLIRVPLAGCTDGTGPNGDNDGIYDNGDGTSGSTAGAMRLDPGTYVIVNDVTTATPPMLHPLNFADTVTLDTPVDTEIHGAIVTDTMVDGAYMAYASMTGVRWFGQDDPIYEIAYGEPTVRGLGLPTSSEWPCVVTYDDNGTSTLGEITPDGALTDQVEFAFNPSDATAGNASINLVGNDDDIANIDLDTGTIDLTASDGFKAIFEFDGRMYGINAVGITNLMSGEIVATLNLNTVFGNFGASEDRAVFFMNSDELVEVTFDDWAVRTWEYDFSEMSALVTHGGFVVVD